ncbi:MAG: hypothetical protein WB760_13550 [Xanthobacteraceae bacterium]
MAQVLAVHEDKTWSWGDFTRGPWNLIAVPLALIVLVNLTGRFIEWVPLIDLVSEKYATWTILVFSRSPIHIRSEWYDYIVLLCVVFIITNVGYYRRIGKLFITDLLSFGLSRSLDQGDPNLKKSWQARVDDLGAFLTGCSTVAVISLLPAYGFLTFMSFFISLHTNAIVAYAKWPLVAAVVVGSGCLIAWRWLLTIGLLFALLVVGNGVYLHWLATPQFLPA